MAFKTANQRLKTTPSSRTPDADATTQGAGSNVDRPLFKKPRKALSVKNGVTTVVISLSGTLEEIQGKNPVQVGEEGLEGKIQFAPDSYYPNTDQASTIRAFLSHKGKIGEHTKVTNVQLTRFVNNFPVPIAVLLSGIEDQPSQQLSVLGYDPLLEKIQSSFSESFSPSTSVIKSASPGSKGSSTLALKNAKPRSSFLPADSEEGGLLSPIAADLYAFSGPFSTSAGLSTHIGGVGDQHASKSSKDEDAMRQGGKSSKNLEQNGKKFSITQLNKSAIPFDNDGVLSTATPWGSPLHVSALNGAVWNTLKKHADVLKQKLDIPEEKIKAAIAAAESIWRSNAGPDVGFFESKRDNSQRTTVLENVSNPAYATFVPPADDSETLFPKDRFQDFVDSVRPGDASWHQEDEGLYDPETWKSQESSEKWWNTLRTDGVWKNAIREWVYQDDRIESARVAIVPRDMVTMYLACLVHERVKSGDMDTRRFTVMFTRLDSPQDWSAQGAMSESQIQSVQGKRFSAEVRLNVHYAILSPESGSAPAIASSFMFETDDFDDDDMYSDDDYDSDGY